MKKETLPKVPKEQVAQYRAFSESIIKKYNISISGKPSVKSGWARISEKIVKIPIITNDYNFVTVLHELGHVICNMPKGKKYVKEYEANKFAFEQYKECTGTEVPQSVKEYFIKYTLSVIVKGLIRRGKIESIPQEIIYFHGINVGEWRKMIDNGYKPFVDRTDKGSKGFLVWHKVGETLCYDFESTFFTRNPAI